jgi:hypothetical protein
MPTPRHSSTELREFITKHFNAHGRIPSYEVLIEKFGYSSASTVHYHLNKLVDAGFLTRGESGARKYEPGPFFVGVPGKASVPAALLKELPSREDVQVLQVDEAWLLDDDLRPGDLIVVGTREPIRQESPVVLRRGDKFVMTEGSRLRRGWESVGVVFGQYRPHARPVA